MGYKMIAIDTNIIVRFLTKDDEIQYKKSYKLFADSTELFIPNTVILETEWVLRFSYCFKSEQIINALLALINLQNIKVEHKENIIMALNWHQQGMDFADALHLASSLNAKKFASFDKKFLKKAKVLNTGLEMLDI
jgi:predicted nucleic-acid-binding protein